MQQPDVQTGRADQGHAVADHDEHNDAATHHADQHNRNRPSYPSLSPPKGQTTVNQPPAKRRRVALACDLCRQRKVRCDGAKPVCTPCQKRGEPPLRCAYNLIPQTARQLEERKYIASLQTQIHQLNRALRHSNVPIPSLNEAQASEALPVQDTPARDSDDSPQSTSRSARKVTNSSLSTARPRTVPVTNPEVTSRTDYQLATPGQSRVDDAAPSSRMENAQYGASESRPSLVTAMGATSVDQAYMSAASTGSNEFYGKSSVHSLLQEVSGGSHHPPTVNAASSRGHQDTSLITARYALPPRQVADELIHLYFTNVHIFYPWTHSTAFQKRYESLWSSEGYHSYVNDDSGDLGLGGKKCPASVFFCALNAMFALGSEFSSSQSRISASEIFCARMHEFLYSDLVDHPGLANVQAMLLAGYYLLTTELPSTCYNVVGMACRIAVGLGMHSDKNATRYTVVEKELRRRLWYGCLQMEMTVSMTLGRPPLLQITDAVPLPMAIDDEFLLTAGDTSVQPDHIIPKTLYMVENVKLIKILAMILDQVYNSDPRPVLDQLASSAASSKDLSNLIHIGDALQRFEANLPAPLQCRTETNNDVPVISILERQGNVLHARVLHLRILLYRPLFSKFYSLAWRSGRGRQENLSLSATGWTDSRSSVQCVSAALQEQCARLCLQSAYDLARSIHAGILRGLPSAWWFSSFYLVTCGGIALLAESANRTAKCFEQQLVDSTWDNCAAALQHIGASHARTAGYLDHLMRLRERIRSGIMTTDPSRWPSGTTTRRPSADHTGAGDIRQDSHDVEVTNNPGDDLQDFASAGISIFDNWDWHLDTSVFGLGDDMNFPLAAFM